LRVNPLQKGGDDGICLSTGPTTRVMVRRIKEDWDSATNGRDTLLYMFGCGIT